MRTSRFLRAGVLAALTLFCLSQSRIHAAGQWAAPSPVSAYSIPSSALLQPEDLNRILHTASAEKPLMFQVGSRMLFDESHIPKSEYIGPGALDYGTQALRNRVAKLPRKTFIVLYCGCCPWSHCPNVGPAYQMLAGMGFTRVKVLYLPNNFGADWASKGYPVESTH